jgi:hypothetical protein
MRNLSKVFVHIFNPFKEKTLGSMCDLKRQNENMEPLNIKRGFNIKNFGEPTWKDLKGRREEMKVVVDADKEKQEKTAPPS